MINIKLNEVNNEEIDKPVSPDEIIRVIDENRNRLRTLAGMILTVCGLLLSTSFIIIPLTITQANIQIPSTIPILLLVTTACLTTSMLYSIFSVLLPPPAAMITKGELVKFFIQVYHKEYRRSIISILFLFLSIILFAIALGVFTLTAF